MPHYGILKNNDSMKINKIKQNKKSDKSAWQNILWESWPSLFMKRGLYQMTGYLREGKSEKEPVWDYIQISGNVKKSMCQMR